MTDGTVHLFLSGLPERRALRRLVVHPPVRECGCPIRGLVAQPTENEVAVTLSDSQQSASDDYEAVYEAGRLGPEIPDNVVRAEALRMGVHVDDLRAGRYPASSSTVRTVHGVMAAESASLKDENLRQADEMGRMAEYVMELQDERNAQAEEIKRLRSVTDALEEYLAARSGPDEEETYTELRAALQTLRDRDNGCSCHPDEEDHHCVVHGTDPNE